MMKLSWRFGRTFSVFMVYLLLVCCFGAPVAGAAEAPAPPMFSPQGQVMPLVPFMDYFIDESLSLDIEEAAAPGRAHFYQPFVLEQLPRAEGIVWLRFRMAPALPDSRPQTWLLDMGSSIPGQPLLFDPQRNELSGAQEWRENAPAQRNIFLLPEAGAEPITCYIRLEGLPGPWFAPMARTPQNAASNWGSLARTGAILALGIVMLLCLLRGMSEQGQWRIWTGMYVGAALAQGIFGMPAVSENFGLQDLLAILLPGIALMLLPHVGRHLLATRKYSRNIDIQLFLLSFPGAAVALWPLAPGWAWLERWLDLWPAMTIILVPTSLAACFMGIPGARRYLFSCLIPPLFVAIGLFGLDFGLPANVLSSAPLWGVAFSALLIATLRSPLTVIQQTADDDGEKPMDAMPDTPLLPASPDNGEIINLEHPLDDPNLRIISTPQEAEEFLSQIGSPQGSHEDDREEPAVSVNPESEEMERRENALREPLDELLRQAAALSACSLPPAARQSADNMVAAAKRMADALTAATLRQPASESQTSERCMTELFNLQHILRASHDSVATIAEYSGIAISWYMPPHLGQFYHGNARQLETVLRLLLESAVRSSSEGAIKLSVRHVPESADPGHILFTVTDNGHGYPPKARSSLAFAKAWELAGQHDGYVSMETGPQGATVVFSAHYVPAEEQAEKENGQPGAHVIVACADASHRRGLCRIIETTPCRITEAGSMHDVITEQRQNPAILLVAHGELAMPSAADMAREFTRLGRQAGLPFCHVLAITEDESQWGRLKPSGFTHAMIEPVDPDVLRKTVMDLTHVSIAQDISEASGGSVAPVAADDVENSFEEEKNEDVPPGEDIHGFADAPCGQGESVFEKDQENVHDADNDGAICKLADSGQSYDQEIQPQPNPAPMMVIDQPMSLAHSFEGPDWLGVESAEEGTRNLPSQSSDPAHIDELPLADAGMENNDASHAGLLRENGGAGDNYEQIGTPASPAPTQQSLKNSDMFKEESPTRPEDVPDTMAGSGVSLSGRAVALGKNRHSGGEQASSIMDFIVGVEVNDARARKEPEASDQPDGQAASGAELPVSAQARPAVTETHEESGLGDFINASANMISDTVSSILAAEKAGIQDSGVNSPHVETPPEVALFQPGADPAITALVGRLDKAAACAQEGFAQQNSAAVAKATELIARDAEAFGLRLLARMALCVERAALANDLNAVHDLLPELEAAVERNRITLTQKKKKA